MQRRETTNHLSSKVLRGGAAGEGGDGKTSSAGKEEGIYWEHGQGDALGPARRRGLEVTPVLDSPEG